MFSSFALRYALIFVSALIHAPFIFGGLWLKPKHPTLALLIAGPSGASYLLSFYTAGQIADRVVCNNQSVFVAVSQVYAELWLKAKIGVLLLLPSRPSRENQAIDER